MPQGVVAATLTSGGVIQKNMIVLQPGYQGQRLACGLTIGREGASDPSDLQIVDPDGDELIRVRVQ